MVEADEREKGGEKGGGKRQGHNLETPAPTADLFIGKEKHYIRHRCMEREGQAIESTWAPSRIGAEGPGTSLGHFRCSVTKNRF